MERLRCKLVHTARAEGKRAPSPRETHRPMRTNLEHRKHKHARGQRSILPTVAASSLSHAQSENLPPELSVLQERLQELEKRNLGLERHLCATTSALELACALPAHSGPGTSEEDFRLMADSAPVLIWITAPDGNHLWFNRMWLNATGRRLEQETGSGWMAGIHPDDIVTCTHILGHALATGEAYTMEYRLRSKDGGYRHVLASAAPRLSPNGEFLGYVGSGTDITERKKTEEALQHSRQMLRHLVSYQERVREDERKRIAREIHDDLGQNLLALRIDVSMLHKRTGDSHPRLNERAGAALAHIDATIKAVRAAINNLRPTVLDLGLNAAIEWQMQEFQRRSGGMHCELVMEEDFLVDDRCATALFRILQESLNNVLRHAQASRVCIRLYRQSDSLVMEVADNGVGIYPDCRRKANSFGLIGIEERIHTLGGELVIDASAERGTMLTISIPLH